MAHLAFFYPLSLVDVSIAPPRAGRGLQHSCQSDVVDEMMLPTRVLREVDIAVDTSPIPIRGLKKLHYKMDTGEGEVVGRIGLTFIYF